MELPVVSFRSLVVRTGTTCAEFVAPSGHAPVTQVGPQHTFPGTATTDDYDCIVLCGQETSGCDSN